MVEKRCYDCRETKPVEAFSLKKRNSDGRNDQCRACFATYYAKWRAANAEHVRQQQKEYCAVNAERQRAKTKAWKLANPERAKANDRRLYEANRKARSEVNRVWRQANAEHIRAGKKRYALENREQIKARCRKFRQENKGVILADRALRKARKRQATPSWLTKEQRREMQEVYKRCVAVSEQTGVPYHVDHIVPITSPFVCGLHVPWNLQILPATENLVKGNRLP